MSGELDDKISEGLRADAPAERDALFRLAVMERRERRRFERRSAVLIGGAAAVAVIAAGGLSAGADLVTTGVVAMLCAAIAVAGLLSASGVRELARRFGSRKA
jgi:fatty acid desaturase